jgi:hypothetical protein
MARSNALICTIALMFLMHTACAAAIVSGPETIGSEPTSARLDALDSADFYPHSLRSGLLLGFCHL